MYFSLAISMYQDTKVAFKNALFLECFQSVKTRNLRALLNWNENAVLGNILISLCCNYDTKHICKRSFWSTNPSFSESDVNMSKFSTEFMATAARKPQSYSLLDFSKSKTLGQVLDLFLKVFHHKVSPGKTWRNPWFQYWKMNSRYLPSSAL